MINETSKQRTSNYFLQIKGTVLFRVITMLASFFTIPLMIEYLGQKQFGVWSTLITIMSWVLFFDLGIGNGLRNKVSECLAKREIYEAREYIATSYTLIGILSLVLLVAITICSYFISWQTIFNTRNISEQILGETVRIALFFVLVNFWIGLVSSIIGAIQKSSLIVLGQLISSLLILAGVFILTLTKTDSIRVMIVIYGISILISNLVLNWWIFQKHSELRPRVEFKIKKVRPLLSIGSQFLAIQLAALIIFTTDKLIITQLFGPEHVTQYEVISRLFGLILSAHGLLMAPLWSAYTESYHLGDFVWIKNMLYYQLRIFGILVIGTLFLGLISKQIIQLWIGPDLHITSGITYAMVLFVIISTWNNIFAFFINGIGLIKWQLITALIAMVINIPLSVFFAKYMELGVKGVILGTSTSLLLAAIVLPIQVYYELKRNTRVNG